MQTPLFNGQFTWSLRDRNPYKAYFSKIGTSMIRTLIHVPAVSVFKRFDCSYMRMKPFVIYHLRVNVYVLRISDRVVIEG